MCSEKEGELYPLKVVYCGNCSLPPEFCQYGQDRENCRRWVEAGECEWVVAGAESGIGVRGRRPSHPQHRRRLRLWRAPRARNKSVTLVTGLAAFGVDLKAAAKLFGTRFACGSSVTGEDEIVIQGDVKDELFELIPHKWPQVEEDMIEDLGDCRR